MMINVQGWFYVFKSRIKTTCMYARLYIHLKMSLRFILCEKDPFNSPQSSLSAKIRNKFQVIRSRKFS